MPQMHLTPWTTAQLNIRHLCPTLTTIVINCCGEPVHSFVGEITLKFNHTGDPLACQSMASHSPPHQETFLYHWCQTSLVCRWLCRIREDLQHLAMLGHSDHLGFLIWLFGKWQEDLADSLGVIWVYCSDGRYTGTTVLSRIFNYLYYGMFPKKISSSSYNKFCIWYIDKCDYTF